MSKSNPVYSILAKTYPESYFVSFELGSHTARTLFSVRPTMYDRTWECGHVSDHERPVVVIQCMHLAGTRKVLAEVMWKEDFDRLNEEQA